MLGLHYFSFETGNRLCNCSRRSWQSQTILTVLKRIFFPIQGTQTHRFWPFYSVWCGNGVHSNPIFLLFFRKNCNREFCTNGWLLIRIKLADIEAKATKILGNHDWKRSTTRLLSHGFGLATLNLETFTNVSYCSNNDTNNKWQIHL